MTACRLGATPVRPGRRALSVRVRRSAERSCATVRGVRSPARRCQPARFPSAPGRAADIRPRAPAPAGRPGTAAHASGAARVRRSSAARSSNSCKCTRRSGFGTNRRAIASSRVVTTTAYPGVARYSKSSTSSYVQASSRTTRNWSAQRPIGRGRSTAAPVPRSCARGCRRRSVHAQSDAPQVEDVVGVGLRPKAGPEHSAAESLRVASS